MLKRGLLSKKIQTSLANNSRIFRIKNVKYSGYYFYMNTNISRGFQICISVPLIQKGLTVLFQKLQLVIYASSFTIL